MNTQIKWSVMLLVGLFAASCSPQKEESKESKSNANSNEMKEETNPSLQSLLDDKKKKFEERADDQIKSIYADGINAVKESGVLQNAIQKGDTAPNFTLNNAVGEPVELYELLKSGPVVLTWYRGGWCPYCNITLHQLQSNLPEFKKAGASLVALTPELPDSSISTSEKHELEFEVLSDLHNEVGKKYGVVFKLTDEVAKIYNKKFDLNGYNGDASNELPLAATYIIAQNGLVTYAFLHEDYRNRAEPAVLLKELNKL